MNNPYSYTVTLFAALTQILKVVLTRLKLGLQAGSVLLLVALFSLTACDGGIFGTGDGEDPKIIVDPDASEGEEPVVSDINEPPDPAEYDINDLNVSAPDENDLAFGNNNLTDADGRALIRVIHAITDEEDSLVLIDRENTDTPLVDLPGLSFLDASTEYFSVDFSIAHDFDFILAEEFRSGTYEKVAGINPLFFSADTVSTMIVRGSVSSGIPIDVLTLKNSAQSGSSLAFLRVIHAAPAFSQVGALDVHLNQEDEVLDPTLPDFDIPLSYEKPDTGYLEVTPGNYTFTGTKVGESVALIPETYAIELNPGQVLTFIIRDNLNGVVGEDVELVVVQDSTLPDPAQPDVRSFMVLRPDGFF